VIIDRDETAILRINFYSGRNTLINFYSGQETLVQVGEPDWYVNINGGRVEIFEIADDEQLIGAELYHCDFYDNGYDCFYGVTWFKCKISK